MELLPDEKPHGLGTPTRIVQKEKNGLLFFLFEGLWVKELRHSEEHFHQKKGIPLS